MRNFVGAKELKALAVGSRLVSRIYLGSTLVWTSLVAYRFVTGVPTDPIPDARWTVLHRYVVEGSGEADIYAEWRFNSTPLYMSAHKRVTCIRINGGGGSLGYIGRWDHGGDKVMAQAWDGSGRVRNVTLNHGDILTLEAYADADNNNLRTLTDHLLQVIPL